MLNVVTSILLAFLFLFVNNCTAKKFKIYLFRTALHWAVKRGHSIVVKYLLENGADQMLVNNNGQIPADLATDQKTLIIFGSTIYSCGVMNVKS